MPFYGFSLLWTTSAAGITIGLLLIIIIVLLVHRLTLLDELIELNFNYYYSALVLTIHFWIKI